MLQYLLAHPWLLSLIGLPALLAAVPPVLRKMEVTALKSLFQEGDPVDQQLIRELVASLVKWTEAKYGEGKGPLKFEAVDSVLAKALPFLTADQRKDLIENAVKQLDAGAHDALDGK